MLLRSHSNVAPESLRGGGGGGGALTYVLTSLRTYVLTSLRPYVLRSHSNAALESLQPGHHTSQPRIMDI